MVTITIIDESTLGKRYTHALYLLDEPLSLRELIRRHAYQEVTTDTAITAPTITRQIRQ